MLLRRIDGKVSLRVCPFIAGYARTGEVEEVSKWLVSSHDMAQESLSVPLEARTGQYVTSRTS